MIMFVYAVMAEIENLIHNLNLCIYYGHGTQVKLYHILVVRQSCWRSICGYKVYKVFVRW